MTETRWLDGTDLKPMFQHARSRMSDRKVRLFACGCCRVLGYDREGEEAARAVAAGERWADAGQDVDGPQVFQSVLMATFAAAHAGEPTAASRMTRAAHCVMAQPEAGFIGYTRPLGERLRWLTLSDIGSMLGIRLGRRNPDEIVWCQVLRCVVANPFRSPALNPTWLNPTAVALANGIYADRAFDRLPILADALQDAGCDNAEVLAHCRADGPHAQGCWVVDLILEKS